MKEALLSVVQQLYYVVLPTEASCNCEKRCKKSIVIIIIYLKQPRTDTVRSYKCKHNFLLSVFGEDDL